MNTDDEKYNEKSWNETHEAYQTARVEGFIPAEWEFEDYLLAEVERLREQPRVTIDEWDKVVGSEHTGPYVTLYFEDGSEYIGALRLYKGICECCDEEGEHDD